MNVFYTSSKIQEKIYLVYYLIGPPELKTTGGKANKINMQRNSTLGTYNFSCKWLLFKDETTQDNINFFLSFPNR